MQPGDTLEPLTVGPVTRTDFVRYQGASGDFNAIHHDEVFAVAAGFPSVFSVGMFQAGVLAAYAADRLGPRNVRSFRVRFQNQVWPGDTLTCRGRVTGRSREANEDRLEIELVCERQNGDPAVTGWATFAIPPQS
jgi:acyl dehydratase